MKIWNYLRALPRKAVLVALVILSAIGAWLLFDHVDWPDEIFSFRLWMKNAEDLRNLVLAVGGPIAVATGLILAGCRTRALLLQARIEGQRHITDRFTKAIEQLGHKEIAVKLGAIYALERIAEDSSRDHWPIMDTLTAFVRESAPGSTLAALDDQTDEDQVATGVDPHQTVDPRPRIDIQAALTVLGRRSLKRREEERADGRQLDLRETHLSGASLKEAHFESADFWATHLDRVSLERTHLEKARLGNASLMGALLVGTHLENAVLAGANLTRAEILGAHLENADFSDASLTWANVRGANLVPARGLTQAQIMEAIGDGTTLLPEGLERPEHWSE